MLSFCVSRSVANSFKSSSDKINVVCNGIDPSEFAPGGEKMSSELFSPQDTLIGQIGTLVEHKKTHILVKAAPLVLKDHPAVKFLIIGCGGEDYTLYLKNLAKELNVEKSVIFWGEETNIKPLLNRLDIICLLSKNEGLSRTLLEAMALEKVVLVSDIPQNTELVTHGKTGFAAKLDSPEDTARCINTILTDWEKSMEMGKAARKLVINEFSLQKTISRIHGLYERLGF